MDPQQFQRALILVVLVGSLMFGIGATALYFAFRAFGQKQAGSQKHLALLAGVIVFVFLCCFALFAVALISER